MIAATGIELRAGSRLLLDGATFRIAAGDRVGLVGRNGAGKTTLTKVLAGAAPPAAGTVTSSGEVGYLPQDPRTGDLHVLARDRILSARGLDQILRDLREVEGAMASADGWSCRASCSPARRPCCWTSRPTTSTPTPSCGSATSSSRTAGGSW